MGVRDRLLADFDHEAASTHRVLMQVRDDRLEWTPHSRARTTGALCAHICDLVAWARPILLLPSFDLDEAAPPSPIPSSAAAIAAAFATAAARTRDDLHRSDAELKVLWCLRQAGVELFALPREAAFRTFILHHMIHHRGQLTVYLRCADLPVPAIYGPAVDKA